MPNLNNRRERLESDLSPEAYGDGGPPRLRTWILMGPGTANGLTPGREYPVLAHRAWTYWVRNDNGHMRAFSMYSDTHAHLGPHDAFNTKLATAQVFEEDED